MSSMASIVRHLLQVLAIVSLCHVISIYTIDAPRPIYQCPIDRQGLANGRSIDENCYWSISYVEAREKFISFGNILKEQSTKGSLDVLDVQSLSYDIAPLDEDYPTYLNALEAKGAFSPEVIVPEKDTVDALLLTVRISDTTSDASEPVNIIHSSGTHGVEGYLGSAVQIRFLHEMIMQNEKQIESNLQTSSSSHGKVRKILLIHAVNPFGMRNHRRANENNVDLNRNVLSKEMWLDVRARDPNFVGYVDMDSDLNPFKPIDGNGNMFSWVDSAKKGRYVGDMTKLQRQDEKVINTEYEDSSPPEEYTVGSSLKEPEGLFNSWLDEKKVIIMDLKDNISSVLTLGYSNCKRALVAAQYHKPCGIFYGGGAHNNNQWEKSIFVLQHAINEFAGFSGFKKSMNRALWIDVHTGLGKYGEYSALVKNVGEQHPSGGSEKNDWASRFASLLEKKGMGYGKSSDQAVSSGYDESLGFVTDQILCPPPHCFALNQEFGTRPGISVAVAYILENKGHHSTGTKYNHLTSWAFYPQRLSWRRKALRGGMEMLNAGLTF